MKDQITTAFLLVVSRSGGLFLLGLFDGHPQVSCIPTELQFHRYWDEYGCDRITTHSELASTILSKFRVRRLKEGPLFYLTAEQQEWRKFNFEALEHYFRSDLSQGIISRRNALLSLHRAYFQATGRDLKDLRLILEFGSMATWNAARLADFPEARFIHLVRDPRAVLSSDKNLTLLHYNELLHPAERSIPKKFMLNYYHEYAVAQHMQHYEWQTKLGPSQYFVMRNEDLNADLPKAIDRLRIWLGIDASPSLLESTILGAPFISNSSYGIRIVGPSPEFTSRYRQHTYALERRALEYIYWRHMERQGYECEYLSSQSRPRDRALALLAWLFPFRGELGWILKPQSRAFSKKEPSQEWLKPVWRVMPTFIVVLRWALIPYFLIRSVPIFLLQRIVIFSRMARGKFDLDPCRIMQDPSAATERGA